MPRSLQDFPAHASDKLRYADTDRQGHVNNAVFATFLETGRVEFLYDAEDPITDDGAEFVVARMELDFRGEIHWPGSVDIGTGIRKIGNSSVTVAQVIYQNDRCVAEAETVIVQLNTATRSSQPLSETATSRLRAFLL